VHSQQRVSVGKVVEVEITAVLPKPDAVEAAVEVEITTTDVDAGERTTTKTIKVAAEVVTTNRMTVVRIPIRITVDQIIKGLSLRISNCLKPLVSEVLRRNDVSSGYPPGV
jgi:hypothetical protein